MVATTALLEDKLKKLLQILKQNKEQVPMETLKSVYAKPYNALTEDIRLTLIAYVKTIVCNGLLITFDDVNEAAQIINDIVEQSNIMKFISVAAYKQYDLERIYSLTAILHTVVIRALSPILDRHTHYWPNKDTLEEVTFPYNTSLHCFFINDAWVMCEHEDDCLSANIQMEGNM
jgi:hypothetical protein